MATDTRPPSFAQLFAREIERSASRRGWRAFVPWWLITCLASPFIVNSYFGYFFNKTPQSADTVAILAALAVIGSFLGSTSIALTAHLQKIISEYPFSNYLKQESIFDSFLFWPQFTLLIQIICISVTILLASLIGIFNLVDYSGIFIVFAIFINIYAFEKTWKLVDLIRIATWHYEDYQSALHLYVEEKPENLDD